MKQKILFVEVLRPHPWVSNRFGYGALVLSYGGAGFMGLLALLLGARVLSFHPSVLALGCGTLLLLAGVQASKSLRMARSLAAERQAKAEALNNQLQEHQNAVDDMADGLDVAIFICDTSANILYANQRAIELFRFQQPTGRDILAVTLSTDLEQLVLDVGRKRTPLNAEVTFSYPDERVGVAKAWSTSDGAERIFLSVFEITELRRLERIRQDFVANVSHELRTPLTIIRSMAETMVDDEPDISERSMKYLNKIVSEVDRLTMISQDLLILSAAESNPVRKQECDICDVFRSVLQQLEPKAIHRGLNLSFKGPDHLWIAANPSQMTQVALNLIDNAIIYTSVGDIGIEVSFDTNSAIVSVSDTGIGIPSDQIKRIFERFYRVDRSRSRATGGTGLGLSIVKHITEAHGGTVTVESVLNHGSTFILRIPIRETS